MPLNDPAWLNAQYNNRALVPDHARHLAHWAEASALTRAKQRLPARPALRRRPAGEPGPVSGAAPGRAGAGVRARRLLARAGQERLLLRRAGLHAGRGDGGGAELRAVPGGERSSTSPGSWCVRCSGSGATRRSTAATRSASSSPGIRPAATWRPCCSAAAGSRWPKICRRSWSGGALSISGLFDLEPIRHTPFLQADLQLTPASVRRLSPAFFPRPKGKLYATVGAAESDEFLRQNQLIRDVWGPTAVPVCETVPGRNHFSVLESLVDPAGRLHDLAAAAAGPALSRARHRLRRYGRALKLCIGARRLPIW